MLQMQLAITYHDVCSVIVAMPRQGAAVVSHAGTSIMLGIHVLWLIISIARAAFVIGIIQQGHVLLALDLYLLPAHNVDVVICRQLDASAAYAVNGTSYPVNVIL